MWGWSDNCKLRARIDELERCKLPKTCYETCEINYGPTSGQYRRVGSFGGGTGIQSQGMGRFTGSHPVWNQPWLGNAQGAVTNSAGGAHFYDRSGGRLARESLAHETYIYIPSAECGPTVTQIRFRSIGEQFAQIRMSPAGGDLNAATVVGQVNYLGPPNTRVIGAPVAVTQDTVYGVLGYSLDRQDNADIEIQYTDGNGTWTDIPHAWMHADLADAQAAESLQTFWCVQGDIGTNESDDRRLTESQVQNLGVSSVAVNCESLVALELQTATADAPFASGVVLSGEDLLGNQVTTPVLTGATVTPVGGAAGSGGDDTRRYEIRYAAPHPDGANHVPQVHGVSNEPNGDESNVAIVEGSITAAGFDVITTVDDNAVAEDPQVFLNFTFEVDAPLAVVVGLSSPDGTVSIN